MKREICKKSCCWTPMGVCARGRNCACHQPAVRVQAEIDALNDLLEES